MTEDTDVRSKVRRAWATALGLDGFGDHDNFFVMGGHSLLVIDLLERIASDTGVAVPVGVFFQAATVADTVGYIEDQKPSRAA